jgi:S-adenosylmethionine/arginine decarboxylase-like enzyme
MKYWGQSAIVNVKACEINRARDPVYIRDFVKQLVKEIDMIPHGEPQVVHFADNTEKAGWTVIQLITTSSIVGHFLDINGDLYLDVFSCKSFEPATVRKVIDDFFSPENIDIRMVFRDAG